MANLEWDSRLDELHVKVIPCNAPPGQEYWKLVKAKYENENESGGNHNVYLTLIDENGAPVAGQEATVYYPGGEPTRPTNNEGKMDMPIFAGGPPWDPKLSGHGGPYGAKVMGAASDRIEGMGMPMHLHVNYRLTFQKTVAQAEAPAPAPAPTPEPVAPAPAPTPPAGPLGKLIADTYAQRGRAQFQAPAAPQGVFQAGWNAAAHGQAVSQEFPVVLGNRGVTMQLFEHALLYHNPDTNQVEPFPNVSLEQIYQSLQSGGPGLELVGRLL